MMEYLLVVANGMVLDRDLASRTAGNGGLKLPMNHPFTISLNRACFTLMQDSIFRKTK
jgi:hypothetical protein